MTPLPAPNDRVTPESLFPNDRGAQRMTRAASGSGARLSLAGMVEEQMPDWADWWSIQEISIGLGLEGEHADALEALLAVRKQARHEAVAGVEQSEAAKQLTNAVRGLGADGAGANPPLEVRAELGGFAARVAAPMIEALRAVDQEFADGCARLLPTHGQLIPDDAFVERVRAGVVRLRGFDPALSRMKLLNTGVDLTIHAAPLLKNIGGELEQASVAEIRSLVASWELIVAPMLVAFERQRAELVAATASNQPLEERLRRRSELRDRGMSLHADLLVASLNSVRAIARVLSEQNPDRANAWLRSTYVALSFTNIGATGGDAAITDALQDCAASIEAGGERFAALAALRTENLRVCAALEGALIDACVRAMRDLETARELMAHAGPVFEINDRRFAQSDGVLARVKLLVPSEVHAQIERAFESQRAQPFHLIPKP